MEQWLESFKSQVQRNMGALIRLPIVISSLGYNTWRYETSEAQRNTRLAAFEPVRNLGDLQQSANLLTYGGETSSSQRIVAWGRMELIKVLSPLMSVSSGVVAQKLFTLWNENVNDLALWHTDDEEDRRVGAIAEEDKEIDRIERVLLGQCEDQLRAGGDAAVSNAKTMVIAHNFERIGDRATNIAERTVFLISGDRVDLND